MTSTSTAVNKQGYVERRQSAAGQGGTPALNTMTKVTLADHLGVGKRSLLMRLGILSPGEGQRLESEDPGRMMVTTEDPSSSDSVKSRITIINSVPGTGTSMVESPPGAMPATACRKENAHTPEYLQPRSFKSLLTREDAPAFPFNLWHDVVCDRHIDFSAIVDDVEAIAPQYEY